MEQIEKLFAHGPTALFLTILAYGGCVVGIGGGFFMLYKLVSHNPALH